MNIRGTTSIYGIIGQPVAHSLSPLFQNRFLHQHHIDAAYVPFPIDNTTLLAPALDGLYHCGVAGFNVTVPYKEHIVAHVACDSDALAIGAVNTVRRTATGWQASNTDHIGIQHVLKSLLDNSENREVLLFGAGGTARAALHACNQIGIDRVWLCNRTLSRADSLIAHAQKQQYQTVVTSIDWDQASVTTACQRAAVLINTTTIGLHNRETFPFILAPQQAPEQGAAFDAVYQPNGSTSFTTAATLQGRHAIDGLPLLIAQGVASFYYWHRLLVDRQQALNDMCHQLQRTPCIMHNWGGDQ